MKLNIILNQIKKAYSGNIIKEIDAAIMEIHYEKPISGEHMPAILHFIEMFYCEPEITKEVRAALSRGREYCLTI